MLNNPTKMRVPDLTVGSCNRRTIRMSVAWMHVGSEPGTQLTANLVQEWLTVGQSKLPAVERQFDS